MKNRRNKFYKAILFSFFSFLLLAGNFVFIPQAQAACSYTLELSASEKSVSINSLFTLDARATKKGDIKDCAKSMSVSFQYRITKGWTSGSFKDLGRVDANFTVDQAKATYPIYLKEKYSSISEDLSNPNSIEFGAYAQFLGGASDSLRSNSFVVAISGAGIGGSQEITIAIEPDKSVYEDGDDLKIITGGIVLPPGGTQKVFAEYWVNNKSVYSFTTSAYPVGTKIRFFPTVKVGSQNNFKNDLNNIRVEFWQAGTSLRIGQKEININAKGLDGRATPPPGSDKVFACKDGGGKYACSPGNKKDLSDVTATGGDCDYDYTDPANVAEQIDRSWCGKTDEQIKNPTSPPVTPPVTPPGSGVDCSKNPDPKYCLYNPIGTDSLTETLLFIAKGFLAIVGLWGVAFIMIGGFKLVMAQGNEEAYLAAKKTIIWAVLGVVVAMLSFSIIAIVQNLIGATVPKAGLRDIIRNKNYALFVIPRSASDEESLNIDIKGSLHSRARSG